LGLVEENINLFAYCDNTPVVYSDHTGLKSSAVVTGATIGAKAVLLSSMVTESRMISIGWTKSKMRYKDLMSALIKYGITNLESIRHFIAQCSHESGLGKWTKELASGKSYEGRKDLGNTQKGDGPKYKGAGFIHITGRANYQKFANSIGNQKIMNGVDYVAVNYPWASSAFWWKANGMNELCAKGTSVEKVTMIVNGGKKGLADRKKYYNKVKSIIK
jgi:putative chitinase